MHEAGEVNILAVVWAIVVVVVASHLIWQQVKAAEYRHQEVLKLQRLAAEEVAWVEQQAEEEARFAKAAKEHRAAGARHQEAFRLQRLAADSIITLADQGEEEEEEEVRTPEAAQEIGLVQETGDEFREARRLHLSPRQPRHHSNVDQEEKVVYAQAANLSPPVAVVNSGAGSSSILQQQTSVTGSSRTSGSSGICAVCATPTKKHCSKCKSVKYCSYKCQIDHWHERHKHECAELEKGLLSPAARSNASSSDDLASVDNASPASVKTEDPKLKTTVIEEPLPAALIPTIRSSEVVIHAGALLKPTRVLFPYEHFMELFTWRKLQLAPCGLINCGNSCFANVVLQCLTHTTPLTAYLLEGYHIKECQRNGWCFMCELEHHVSKVAESQFALTPLHIVSKIRNIGNHMGYGRQEDAHEFMRYAIDSMQSICLDKVGGEKAVDQQTQETTVIQHIFGGHLQSQIRCMQCYHESYKYENMMDIAVEIQGDVETLQDGLAQFTADEWLDGDNKYKCERCNAYVEARKRLLIHTAPNVLTIALKRFQSGNFGKLNKRVMFPSVLDMTPFMSKAGDSPSPYELYGVIVHIDMQNSSFCGHYICYIKDLHGFWYKIDDSVVSKVDLENVMQQRAYMLFYKRSTPRRALLIKGENSAVDSGSAMSNGHNVAEDPPVVALYDSADRNNLHGSNGNGVILSRKVSDILTR